MTKAEYAAYLLTPHWKDLRSRKISTCGPRCQDCGNDRLIQVHHLRYRNIFDVLLDDLKVVCRACHEKIHGIIAFPTPKSAPPKQERVPEQPGVVWLRIMPNGDVRMPTRFESGICVEAPMGFSDFVGLQLHDAKNRLRQKGLGFEVGPTPYPKPNRKSARSGFLASRAKARQKHGRPKRKKAVKSKKVFHPVFYTRSSKQRWVNRGNSSN